MCSSVGACELSARTPRKIFFLPLWLVVSVHTRNWSSRAHEEDIIQCRSSFLLTSFDEFFLHQRRTPESKTCTDFVPWKPKNCINLFLRLTISSCLLLVGIFVLISLTVVLLDRILHLQVHDLINHCLLHYHYHHHHHHHLRRNHHHNIHHSSTFNIHLLRSHSIYSNIWRRLDRTSHPSTYDSRFNKPSHVLFKSKSLSFDNSSVKQVLSTI